MVGIISDITLLDKKYYIGIKIYFNNIPMMIWRRKSIYKACVYSPYAKLILS